MALRIEYEQEALEDIALAGQQARTEFGDPTAEKLLERIRSVVHRLAEQPDSGRNVDISSHPALSAFQFVPLVNFPYLIFFGHDERTLRVYAVVYAKRDLPAFFLERWPEEDT